MNFSAIDVSAIPSLNLQVERDLLRLLEEEVIAYSENVRGSTCILCPFRRFDRPSRLKEHLKYHIEGNMFFADLYTIQRSVVKAYYDYRCSITPLVPFETKDIGLLKRSASLIAEWNSRCSQPVLLALQKQNRPVLTLVLTHTGPEYWAKELTGGCFRHSQKLHYTPMFADLFLSILLTNEGRISTSIDALYLHFGTTSELSGLLPSARVVWNDIATVLTTGVQFSAKVKVLKYEAAVAGEYTVITHDETFKSLFNLIGQEKMAQVEGELHALHTFRGFTGGTVGLSAQRSTSDVCFRKAVIATFDDYLAGKVRFLFSDTPLRIIRGARACFPTLLAVGEDPIHLALRLEYCCSGKIYGPSVRVRQLHNKFRIPTERVMPFWQPEDDLGADLPWPTDISEDTRTPDEWNAFCKSAFDDRTGYITYVQELAKIFLTFRRFMNKKDSKGTTVAQILQNGASRIHFEGLQNASRLMARLGVKGERLGVGTTRNEQLHRELKCWMRNIYQSHEDRLQLGLRIFIFTKLLTHSSAAYSPTLRQIRQHRLLSVLAGKLRTAHFFIQPEENISQGTSPLAEGRALIRLPNTSVDERTSSVRQSSRENRSDNWKKMTRTNREPRFSTTDVFKRRRKQP